VSNKNTFAPGGALYGYVGDDQYIFPSWRAVWTAVTTEGHELAKQASWILSARRYIKPTALTKIRISLDASPPIVETVFPRWLGWIGTVAFGFVFWVFAIAFIGG
jgi:hypothetical protein